MRETALKVDQAAFSSMVVISRLTILLWTAHYRDHPV